MDVTFFKLTPFFTIDFQERRINEDSDQLEYFQLEESLVVYSSTPLVQFESQNIVVLDLSESSSLNNENAYPSLVLSHIDHDSNITNGKKIGTKNIGLIPDIVYLRMNTTQKKSHLISCTTMSPHILQVTLFLSLHNLFNLLQVLIPSPGVLCSILVSLEILIFPWLSAKV